MSGGVLRRGELAAQPAPHPQPPAPDVIPDAVGVRTLPVKPVHLPRRCSRPCFGWAPPSPDGDFVDDYAIAIAGRLTTAANSWNPPQCRGMSCSGIMRMSEDFFPTPNDCRERTRGDGVPSNEMAHLELLAEVDALAVRLSRWAEDAPAWQPADQCRAWCGGWWSGPPPCACGSRPP